MHMRERERAGDQRDRPREVLRRRPGARRRRPRGRRRARVLGLLGPNGAGKTTAVRVLTTLLKPDAGTVRVTGLDVVRDAAQLRARIGLAGQYAAVDENLTGLENLVDGRAPVRRAPRGGQARAAQELLERFDLVDAAEPPRQDLLGRHAPAARPRRRARRQPAGALPRRADDRPGPAQPPGGVGDDRGAGGRGHDRAADHAVPRRGRPPGRPHRGHRPRPRDRRGHARRAQGPRRRRAPRGPPRRRRRGRDAPSRRSRRCPTSRRSSTRRPSGCRSAGAPARSSRRCAGSTRPASASTTSALRRPTLDDVFLSLTGHAAEAADDETRRRRHEAAGLRHAGDRRAQPRAPPARARPADRLHGAAGHVRAALRLRLRRRDLHAGLQLRRLPDPRDHRPEHRLRRLRHGARAQRGPPQGPDRPLPLAADGARGGAGRPHAGRRRDELRCRSSCCS